MDVCEELGSNDREYIEEYAKQSQIIASLGKDIDRA